MNPSRGPGLGRLYGLTILLSAFLLFQVQPLLSKWILPWFGGGPAVWTTCLLFFQSALFAGYAYAHFSDRFGKAGWRLAAHLGLVAAAVALLPIGPHDGWKPTGSGDPTWPILLLLGANVGAPYFLLSSTGPLVQAWFSRAYPDRSPYRLFALSNVGSLAALVTYPLVFEPRWGLRTQSIFWTWTFAGFAVLCAAGVLAVWRVDRRRAPAPVTEEPAPPAWHRVLWIALPAFASWMLVSSTNRLCQDVAVIPFLWVLPLVVYLISFILSFEHPRQYKPLVYVPGTIVLVFAAAAVSVIHAAHTVVFVLGIGMTLGALFCLCMVCHGELARLKPAARHLTAYYLAVSGGGALGGIFVSLVAPQLFSTFLEWKLGLGIAYGAAWGLLAWIGRGRVRAHLNIAAGLLAVAVTGLAFIGAFFGTYGRRLESVRNFYGVVIVEYAPGGGRPEGDSLDMINGRILHGRQFLNRAYRHTPTGYYAEASGVGRAVALFRSREDLRVGVVGLGAGMMAAFAELPSQSFRFYEINPEVKRLAEAHFTYLKEGPGRVDVVLGDARRSLEGEPPQGFHVLALDAFTGSIIPTHLLTAEAMEIYLRHLAPDGVIAVHVSNHYLDLGPVVRGVAGRAGLKTLEVEITAGRHEMGESSRWMLCTRSESVRQELSRHATKGGDAREVVWTDDHSDLFSILRLR